MASDISTDDDSSNEYKYYNNYVVFEPHNQSDKHGLEDYPFEVLTIEKILQHMNECIEEVRNYIEVLHIYIIYFFNMHICLCSRCPLLQLECSLTTFAGTRKN